MDDVKRIACETVMHAQVCSECPNDPSEKIVYDLWVSPKIFMPVEELVAAMAALHDAKPMFQEDLTAHFAARFKPFMASVTMRGVHLGVELLTRSL